MLETSTADMFIAIGCLLKKFRVPFEVYFDEVILIYLSETFSSRLHVQNKKKEKETQQTHEQQGSR